MNQLHVLTYSNAGEGEEPHLIGVFSSPSKVAVAIADHRKTEKTTDDTGWQMTASTDSQDVNITRFALFEPGNTPGEDDVSGFYRSTIVQVDEAGKHYL